jgi:hypothetical protein
VAGATQDPLAPVTGEVVVASETVTRSVGLITRVEYYEDIRYGDKVIITDPKWAMFRGIKFEFLCMATNEDTGRSWLECWGGKRQHEARYAFGLEFVKKV